MEPVTYVLGGCLLAVISGVAGKIIGSNGKVKDSTCNERRHACTELINQKLEQIDEKLDETKAVVLDMDGLEYISSAGIGIVIWAKGAFKKINASFSMVNLKPQIKKVFDAMKILPMIDVFSDMPEADKYIDQIIQEEIGKQNT